MKKANITIAFDDEKLDALEFSLKKENATVQSRMDEALQKLYEETVPEPVREYLDSRAAPVQKPRRPPRPSKPQIAEPKAPLSAITPHTETHGKAGD